MIICVVDCSSKQSSVELATKSGSDSSTLWWVGQVTHTRNILSIHNASNPPIINIFCCIIVSLCIHIVNKPAFYIFRYSFHLPLTNNVNTCDASQILAFSFHHSSHFSCYHSFLLLNMCWYYWIKISFRWQDHNNLYRYRDGGRGALCVEMGFYADISWESRCNIEINERTFIRFC